MYGLIGAGRQIKDEAMEGLSDSANRDQSREITKYSLTNAKKTLDTTSMSAGAVSGAMIGSSMAAGGGAAAGASAGATSGSVVPGLGTIIGAAIRLLAGWALR